MIHLLFIRKDGEFLAKERGTKVIAYGTGLTFDHFRFSVKVYTEDMDETKLVLDDGITTTKLWYVSLSDDCW